MNIFIYINTLSVGGAERVATNLANFLSEKGNEVTIVAESNPSRDFYHLYPSVRRIRLNKDTIEGKSFSLGGFVNRCYNLRRLLVRDKPDVLLGLMTAYCIVSILAACGLSTNVYVSERNYPPLKPQPLHWRILRRLLYRFAEGGSALTSETARWMEKKCGMNHVDVIPVSLDLPLAVTEPILNPKEWMLDKAFNRYILNVGRLHDQKNQIDVIRSFGRLAEKFPDWGCAVVGEGSLRKVLEAEIDKLGLQERCFLVGRVGNVADWYNNSSVFVFTSKYEGFGNVVAEAMAHGCPVVSYNCPVGPSDIIEDGVNGILVETGNMQELVRQLDRLMTDRRTAERLAAKAKKVREAYSNGSIMPLWLDHLSIES